MSADLLPRTAYRDLPGIADWPNSSHIYAIEFSDGTVKVGSSYNLRQRAEALHDFAGRYGIGVRGLYAERIGHRQGQFAVELSVIHHMARKVGPAAYGREWFSGCGINAAIEAIKATKQPARRRGAKVPA